MPSEITCPDCGHILILPPDCITEVPSCPRCLTPLNNLRAAEASTAVQAEVLPEDKTAVTPSPTSLDSGPRIADLDVDVRRDNWRIGCPMTLLSLIGGLGIAYALLSGVPDLVQAVVSLLLVVLGVITMLTLLSAIAGWIEGKRFGTFLGRMVLEVLTITGALIGVGVLFLVVTLILLFVACVSKGCKW